MDTPSRTRRRQRRRRSPLVPDLALIANLFVHSCYHSVAEAALPALPAPLARRRSHRLDRRIAGEHVVLADCRDSNEVVSSQMAYYVAEIGPTPKDVAVVGTTRGQAALWVNTNTTGRFTDTGVVFTSVLGPRVDESEYAGMGYNNYTSFTCYQSYFKDRYTYDMTTCSQVYMCDHSKPPITTTTAATSGGMAQGTIIGIAVGVVGGVLFVLALGVVYWYLRRARRNRQAADGGNTVLGTVTATASSTAGGPRTHSTGPGSDAGALDSASSASKSPRLPGQDAIPLGAVYYEMDGRHHRVVEMGTDKAKFEMDAAGHGRAELGPATGGSGPSSPGMNQAYPMSPALPDSPAVPGPAQTFPWPPQASPPQSPPPEHFSYSYSPR